MEARQAPGWWDLKRFERRRAMRLARQGEPDPDPVVAEAADDWAARIVRASAWRELAKNLTMVTVAVVALGVAIYWKGGYLPFGLLVLPALLVLWTSWSERRRARQLLRVPRRTGPRRDDFA